MLHSQRAVWFRVASIRRFSALSQPSKARSRLQRVGIAAAVVGAPFAGFAAYEKFQYMRAPALKPVKEAEMPLDIQQWGKFDVVVVGGGIIGLATANEVLKRFPEMTVAVVEKEAEVAAHQSGHNSGVIHAGMYYEPGTVMAKCCVEGAQMIYDYATKKGIPHERVGKLICAPSEAGHKMVEELYKRGTANGVKDLRILMRDEVKELEPNVDVYSALDSPNTGIIDYGDVTRHLAKDLAATGRGKIELRYEVKEVKTVTGQDGKKEVEVRGVEPGQCGPLKVIQAKNVITCGGVHMDTLGKMTGGAANPKVMTFRGRYYQMKPEFRNIVKRNVYPVPSGGGIPVGVHFTPTCGGYRQQQMIIGPGACMTFHKEGYSFFQTDLKYLWNQCVTNQGFWMFAIKNLKLSFGELLKDAAKPVFLAEARQLVPSLTPDMVEDSFTGVMAQVFMEDGTAAKDYIFERNLLDGTTLNLRNAPSPAATSSMAIAKELVNCAVQDFNWA